MDHATSADDPDDTSAGTVPRPPAARLRGLLAAGLDHLGSLAEARHRPAAPPNPSCTDDEVLAAATCYLDARRRELDRAGRGDGDAAAALAAALDALGAGTAQPEGTAQ